MFFKKYGNKEVEVMGVSFGGLDRMLVISNMYQGVRYVCFFEGKPLSLYWEIESSNWYNWGKKLEEEVIDNGDFM